ncbi:MAG: hypothetical protein HYR66_16975 [Sphingobacteriales bacterium]|nr:hypothetical protein [Sphingobacteriales bacterium]MBI3720134.1 hypothetical protein [Sphingobacteriales bacterium]
MQLSKSKTELLEEAKVRGLCAAVSADMEALLLRLILYCIVDKPNEAYRKFRHLTLGQKIRWAKKDLKEFYPKKFEQHKNDFENLSKFNEFRGQLIHCDIIWKDDTYNIFSVLDIRKIKNEWRIVPVQYSKHDVALKVSEFGKLIINFAQTTKNIIEEVENKYPELIKY